MGSAARQMQRKTPQSRKRSSQPLREPSSRATERRERMRNAFSDARRGSTDVLSVRKSRCLGVAITLENSIKRLCLTESYKLGASSCRWEWKPDYRSAGVLRLWRKHFSTLLQGDDDTNTAYSDDVPNQINDDGVEPHSHEEVKVAIMRQCRSWWLSRWIV